MLETPITFHHSGKTADNRIMKSAMTERLCLWDDDLAASDARGTPTPEYLKLYEEWGKGGMGIIVLGNIPVDRRYPEAKGNAIIDMTATWDHVAAFKPVIAAGKAHGSLVIGQLTHGGRQTNADICLEPISASDVQNPPAFGMVFNKPRPMTIHEIEDLVKRSAYAAKVLYDAGADGVQYHAAHGYLLSQFLSPNVNLRTDKYGGSMENRSRLVFEIIAAIRKEVPDPRFLMSMKINSADFTLGGFSEEDCQELIPRLEAAGLDFIELSGGTYESTDEIRQRASSERREAFFIDFAAKIRPLLVHCKLCVTGGFRSRAVMEAALASHATDIIGMARPLTAEPTLPELLAAHKDAKAKENLVFLPLQTASSIQQIGQIARGQVLYDLSDPVVARNVKEALLGK